MRILGKLENFDKKIFHSIRPSALEIVPVRRLKKRKTWIRTKYLVADIFIFAYT